VRLRLKRRKTFPQRYHRFLCRLFGIRVTVVGRPVCSSGVLMVANHTSYFDILVLSSAARRFLCRQKRGRELALVWNVGEAPGNGVHRTRETFADRRSPRLDSRTPRARRCASSCFRKERPMTANRVLSFKSALMGAAEAELGNGCAGAGAACPGAARVSVLCRPLWSADGARYASAVCLVWRHGAGAAFMGSHADGPFRGGRRVP